MDMGTRARLVRVAMGEEPAELVLRGGRVVSVTTREVVAADVSIAAGRIAAVGTLATGVVGAATEVLDLDGRFLAPGLIDPHIHVESSNLTVTELARAIVPRGVLSLCADPHEIANVLGLAGIELLVEEAARLPLNLLMRVPGRVPAMPPHLETSGAALDDDDIAALLARPDAVALGGDINPALLLLADPATLLRIQTAVALGRTVGGQLPGMVGPPLDACVAAGLEDTHVAESVDEVIEQLRHGIRVLLTPRPDRLPPEEWPELAARIRRDGIDTRYLVLCTDDIHPNLLYREGHLDQRVRLAVGSGFDPVQAVQMATINTAELMRMDRDRGSVAPGRVGDLVVLDDLAAFTVSSVLHDGRVVARDGALAVEPQVFEHPAWARDTIHLARPVEPADLVLVGPEGATAVDATVVEFGGPKTMRVARLPVVDGIVAPDAAGDVNRMAVVERHSGAGASGRCFIGGLGIRGGAFASTVNHDSHNIVVYGDDPRDMALAANTLAAAGGGYCTVVAGEVRALLALPIAGLMSDRPLAEVAADLEAVERALVEDLGCRVDYRPLYALNFMCLPNIPLVGVTDQGIIETGTFSVVPPLVGAATPVTGNAG
jgi:adenine deaminase